MSINNVNDHPYEQANAPPSCSNFMPPIKIPIDTHPPSCYHMKNRITKYSYPEWRRDRPDDARQPAKAWCQFLQFKD